MRRRNPETEVVPYRPKTAHEKAVIRDLTKTYVDHHWGAKPSKILKVRDPLVPDVTAMGLQQEIETEEFGTLMFGPNCWLTWNKKHKRTPLYLVLSGKEREKYRNIMKHVSAKQTRPIQEIAREAGGHQVDHRLPNVKGVSLGPIISTTYHTEKIPDGPSDYFHEFGSDGLGGYLPFAAIDVSGRIWYVGGSYIVREAGICGAWFLAFMLLAHSAAGMV